MTVKLTNLTINHSRAGKQTFDIEIPKGLTVLIGANGYGKSTTIRAIRSYFSKKQLEKDFLHRDIKDIDILTSKGQIQSELSNSYNNRLDENIKLVFMTIDPFSDEDFHCLLGLAMSTPYLSIEDVSKKSEGYMKQIFLNGVYTNLGYIRQLGYKGDIVILIDGLESGVTKDLADFYAQALDRILVEFKDLNLHIVATSNSYSFCDKENFSSNLIIKDPITMETLKIDSKEEFDNHIKKTSTVEENNQLIF